MPSRNAIKCYSSYSYYHIYNRGIEKKNIFESAENKEKFLRLVSRYLDTENTECDRDGVPYRKFNDQIELLSYCIMDNHFHFLIWVADDARSLSEFMRSLGSAYTMYFNKRYDRVGPLFQSRYKAVTIGNDSQLLHITRYIHLNPGPSSFEYAYSSLGRYLQKSSNDDVLNCLNPKRILELFEIGSYEDFLRSELNTEST